MELIKETLKQELLKCSDTEDVPVSALLLNSNNKIIATSYNMREKNKTITGHAEILLIDEIFKTTGSKNLKEYKMYVTLEPCMMCLGALEQTGIQEVVYFLESPKFGSSNIAKNIKFTKVEDFEFEEFLKKTLQVFFKNIR